MSIESRFDIPLIASMALKEKQIQQNYRPIIAVHKWFARRPGNPIAAWIVREELEHLDLDAYRAAAASLMSTLEKKIGDFYRTDCPHYGDHNVPVKYFLWVKTLPCENCGEAVDLLPGYLVADNTRHPRNVVACANCGELNEVEKLDNPARCGNCKKRLVLEGPAPVVAAARAKPVAMSTPFLGRTTALWHISCGRSSTMTRRAKSIIRDASLRSRTPKT
jgi:adenine-specific DNA methylase